MKTQYVKQPSGAIIAFEAFYVTNDAGKEVQVTSAVGEPVTKAAYEKQGAKRKKEKAEHQEKDAKTHKGKHATKKAAQQKLAKATGLTADEMKALFGG